MWRACLSESAWTGLRLFLSIGWAVTTSQLWPCWLFFCLQQKRGKWEILKKMEFTNHQSKLYNFFLTFVFPLTLSFTNSVPFATLCMFTALSSQIYVPPGTEGRGRRIEEEEEEEDPGPERGFLLKSEQQLIIEPSSLWRRSACDTNAGIASRNPKLGTKQQLIRC